MCPPPPPIGFSQIAENGGAQRRQIWHSCSFILCAYCVKILAPGHIRSGLQVTLSDVTSKRNLATLTPCHSHSYEPSVFKLLEVDEVNSSSNLYISDFLYSWPAHVKSMGKISTTSFSHQNISIHWEWCWLRSSVMTQATVSIGDPPKVIWGHLRSPTVFHQPKLSPKNCFAQKCRFWPFVTSDA